MTDAVNLFVFKGAVMKILAGGLGALLLAVLMTGHTLKATSSCEGLASLALQNTKITLAQTVPAGAFTPPGAGGAATPAPAAAQAFKGLSAFCRVAATLKPTNDSDIKVEVWLPAEGWNGKFQAVGNGGWAGVISYAAMADAIRAGYATASTDTGHVGGRGSFALDHPEKLIDFAWRSEHEMTVMAKTLVQAFYGSAPRLSYWNGCSTGGRQGLKEAQKFPDDYDGIIAGAPANRTAISLWIAAAVLKDPLEPSARTRLRRLALRLSAVVSRTMPV
jgi:feruloyl esterase